jgi:PD-(D/E)XK endonuclease
MNEIIKGKGSVGVAICYFSLRGMISIPLEPCDYNLIFDDGVDLYKIKVISCSFKTKYGIYSASIRTSGGNQPNTSVKKFDANSCDIVFVVTSELEMYSIPSSEITSKRQISLNVYDTYKVNFIPS